MAESRLHQQSQGSATVEQDPTESQVYTGIDNSSRFSAG